MKADGSLVVVVVIVVVLVLLLLLLLLLLTSFRRGNIWISRLMDSYPAL